MVRHFVAYPSICVCYFPLLDWANVLWEEDHGEQVLFSSHHVTATYMLSTWCINVDINLDHLTEMVLARFLYFKILFPLFPYCTPGRSHHGQPTLKEWIVMFPLLEGIVSINSIWNSGQSIYKHDLEFCTGDLSILSNLFNHLLMS